MDEEELKEGFIGEKKVNSSLQSSEIIIDKKEDEVKPIKKEDIKAANRIINQKYPLNFLTPDQALVLLKPFKWLCKCIFIIF